MPSTYHSHTVFSLREVTDSIRKTIEGRYSSAYWVKAEMNKLNFYSYSGHCYPDLVEKSEGKVIAQLRAVIWGKDFQSINNKFQKILGEPLHDGINILLLAQIQFDGVHGLSLRIIDIDPVFSLGELEKEKQATLDQLAREGLLNRNKLLPLPLLPQRIAIISVETSKGYADFLKILDGNPYGFRFFHYLFPANLQGEKAVFSIRRQLYNIGKCLDLFDVVVIVRGGGGDVGLSAFNNFELSRDIALFPIPVLTGIGHATNETVVEMVAHKNAITPTEIANIFLQKFQDFAQALQQIQQKIIQRTNQKLQEEKAHFEQSLKYLRTLTLNLISHRKNALTTVSGTLSQSILFLIKREKTNHLATSVQLERSIISFIGLQKQQLATAANQLELLDPKNVLKRGFSITFLNGKALHSAKGIKKGDQLESRLAEDSIFSEVTSILKK